jgi:hypothetical protein
MHTKSEGVAFSADRSPTVVSGRDSADNYADDASTDERARCAKMDRESVTSSTLRY